MKKSLLLSALAVTVLFSVVAFATADTANYNGAGTPLTASGTVNVNANVNPKMTLTVDTPAGAQTVNFGPVDPGTTGNAGGTVVLTVNSNKAFDVAVTPSLADFTDNGLVVGRTLNSTRSYSGTVAYTVTQN